MGLPWSMENLFSWRSQFDRMERWQRRIATCEASESDENILDLYLAFFVACYSLRDWFVTAEVVSGDVIDELIRSNRAMRLCRDICNRSKHLRISRPSADPDFSIAREYRGKGQPNALVVIAAGDQLDLAEVVRSCLRFWSDFLRGYRPAEPRSPFDMKPPRI
jgi:hypothetical protein